MPHKLIIVLFCFCFFKNEGGNESSDKKYSEEGYASYYDEDFLGKKTASGELFNMMDYTAAHPALPFGTYLRVTNLKNHYNIIVRVNDRGPYAKNRIIDLTEGAARRIGCYKKGVTRVKVEEINLLQLTPELDSIFNRGHVTDCLGNSETLSGFSLSVWSTAELLHAIYIANDLFLKEDVEKVYIVTKKSDDSKRYHVVISGIEKRVSANELKSYFEQKGFMKVGFIK
ncbi:MAG: septal ring lytic transglycosylase RlpA family protein [Bacteroidia bacterium]